MSSLHLKYCYFMGNSSETVCFYSL